jgi:uncharacterized protein (DUF58 family)
LGFHFLFVALFAIIGGSLRGFNLLLVLAGLLISVVLVQWRYGRSAIRRSRLTRDAPLGVYAGQTSTIRYRVSNCGRFVPLWLIRIEDIWQLDTSILDAPRQDSSGKPTATSPWEHGNHEQGSIVAGVGSVPAGKSQTTSVQCRFSRRGRYRLGPLITSTTFPFSLMQCERMGDRSTQDLFVYPQLLQLRKGWENLLPPRRGGQGNRSTGGTDHDGEFFGLRPWQSGDHLKHIHWRTTARLGEPAVKQFEQRNRHQVCIVVDGSVGLASSSNPRSFELALELAATLLWQLGNHSGSAALLVADQVNDATLLQSNGRDCTELLRRLAIARPIRADEPLPYRDPADQERPADQLSQTLVDAGAMLKRYDLLVISTRKLEEAIGKRSRPINPSLGRRAAVGKDDRKRSVRAAAQTIWQHFDQAGRLAWLNVNSDDVHRYLPESPKRPAPPSTRRSSVGPNPRSQTALS